MGCLPRRLRQGQTWSTSADGNGGIPGLRVLSCSRPATPSRINRSCQRHTQGFETSARRIISTVPQPSFDEWTETFGSERLTGALLDRLTHHVSILKMNGDSYRLGQSRARKTRAAAEARP